MIVIDDCDWCGPFIEKLKNKLNEDEFKKIEIVSLTQDQKFIDIAADLEIVEYPTVVEVFDDGNVCVLDDFDHTKVKRCKFDRCDTRAKPKPAEIEI